MPSIRNIRHKATTTIKKNIILNDEMKLLFSDLVKKFGRDNLELWREVYKRKHYDSYKFADEIEKGEKALPKDLVKKLDEELKSNRRKTMFFKVIERNLHIRKLYDIDKYIKK